RFSRDWSSDVCSSDLTACVWGGQATELLDFLAVAEQRRIERESVLDADDERALHGLVLLDMPDHDSVAEEHAHQVDRLVPLVDSAEARRGGVGERGRW